MDCARSIVQSGINEVIVHSRWNHSTMDVWSKNAERTVILFDEANVKLREFDDKIITEIYGWIRERKIIDV